MKEDFAVSIHRVAFFSSRAYIVRLSNILFIGAVFNRAEALATRRGTSLVTLIALFALASLAFAAEPAPADTGAMHTVA